MCACALPAASRELQASNPKSDKTGKEGSLERVNERPRQARSPAPDRKQLSTELKVDLKRTSTRHATAIIVGCEKGNSTFKLSHISPAASCPRSGRSLRPTPRGNGRPHPALASKLASLNFEEGTREGQSRRKKGEERKEDIFPHYLRPPSLSLFLSPRRGRASSCAVCGRSISSPSR